MVVVTNVEYARLQEAEEILEYLRAHGVDNWSGYAEAMKAYYDDEDEDA